MAEPITIPDIQFQSFQKIARVSKSLTCVVTEKLDGTNAQIVIENGRIVGVGSRSRWIKPGKEHDNFGFAGWVERNYDELLKLGDGAHFGEWFGNGIQRGYDLQDKRFALFNASRWVDPETRPTCVTVVPVLYQGTFSEDVVRSTMRTLATNGSFMVPGFMKPEGVVVYLAGPRILLKDTFEHQNGKWVDELALAA